MRSLGRRKLCGRAPGGAAGKPGKSPARGLMLPEGGWLVCSGGLGAVSAGE